MSAGPQVQLAVLWPWLLMATLQAGLGHTGLALAAAVESERAAAQKAIIRVIPLKVEPIILEGEFANVAEVTPAEGKLLQVRAGGCHSGSLATRPNLFPFPPALGSVPRRGFVNLCRAPCAVPADLVTGAEGTASCKGLSLPSGTSCGCALLLRNCGCGRLIQWRLFRILIDVIKLSVLSHMSGCETSDRRQD